MIAEQPVHPTRDWGSRMQFQLVTDLSQGPNGPTSYDEDGLTVWGLFYPNTVTECFGKLKVGWSEIADPRDALALIQESTTGSVGAIPDEETFIVLVKAVCDYALIQKS
jgi:hypothetical protein